MARRDEFALSERYSSDSTNYGYEIKMTSTGDSNDATGVSISESETAESGTIREFGPGRFRVDAVETTESSEGPGADIVVRTRNQGTVRLPTELLPVTDPVDLIGEWWRLEITHVDLPGTILGKEAVWRLKPTIPQI